MIKSSTERTTALNDYYMLSSILDRKLDPVEYSVVEHYMTKFRRDPTTALNDEQREWAETLYEVSRARPVTTVAVTHHLPKRPPCG